MFNVVSAIQQFSNKVKTSVGVEIDSESMFIITFTTDDDGVLKMKQIEGFADSQGQFEFAKAVAEARADRKNVA